MDKKKDKDDTLDKEEKADVDDTQNDDEETDKLQKKISKVTRRNSGSVEKGVERSDSSGEEDNDKKQ